MNTLTTAPHTPSFRPPALDCTSPQLSYELRLMLKIQELDRSGEFPWLKNALVEELKRIMKP